MNGDGRGCVARPKETWGIVLSAGTGSRFGGGKQYVELAGGRLIDRAVAACVAACDHTVLVLPHGAAWDGQPVDRTVEGGASRNESVRAALSAIPTEAAIIVVHGASHPLASVALFEEVIARVHAGAAAAAPGLAPSDLVGRVVDGGLVQSIGRDDLVLVQTPYAFRAAALRAAHALPDDATEDLQLVQRLGEAIEIVRGEPWNLHVVTPQDVELARCWEAMRSDRR